jgi:hypothetical protein
LPGGDGWLPGVKLAGSCAQVKFPANRLRKSPRTSGVTICSSERMSGAPDAGHSGWPSQCHSARPHDTHHIASEMLPITGSDPVHVAHRINLLPSKPSAHAAGTPGSRDHDAHVALASHAALHSVALVAARPVNRMLLLSCVASGARDVSLLTARGRLSKNKT